MGDIPVAANDDIAPAGGEFAKDRVKARHEAELGLLTFRRTGTGGQVERDDRQPTEIGAQITSFSVEFRIADAFLHLIRLLP